MFDQILPKKTSPFKKTAYYLFLLAAFVFPLAFYPKFNNGFDLIKWGVLVFVVLSGLILWSLDCIWQKKVLIKINGLAKALLLFALALIIASLVNSANRISPFWGKTGIIISLAIFYILNLTLLEEKAKHIFWSLIASSFIISWIAIFAYLELLAKFFPNLPAINSKFFTPAGSPLSLISLLVMLLPATIALGIKSKENLFKIQLFGVAAVQITALLLTLPLLVNSNADSLIKFNFLPYSAGWSIAVDQFKNLKSAFFGVGPDNFISAFSRFKPLFLNKTAIWNLRFTSSSNEIFNVLTTAGIFGLSSLAWLITVIIFQLKKASRNSWSINIGLSIIIGLILLLVLPANYVLIFTLISLLASLFQESSVAISISKAKIVPIVSLAVLFTAIALGYFSLKVLAAEASFSKSLTAAVNNQGTNTYNLQLAAIKKNPFNVQYRLAYSNTNLAIANSLASKEKPSDEDKKTITQLISQSIRYGKDSVAMAPNNPLAWINLANIYRQLIGSAQGADNWALTSYVQAVRLDPINPILRLELGSLLYTLQNYDSAIDQFKRSIELKPDFANAYYNLSFAFKAKKDFQQAYEAMQKALSLIDKDTNDFDKASTALENLKALLPQETRTATGSAVRKPSAQLTEPQPAPSPNPAVNIPSNPNAQKELAPPVNPVTPTEKEQQGLPSIPSPTPTPSPTP